MSKIFAGILFLMATPAFAFHVVTQTKPSKLHGSTTSTDVTMTVDIGKNALADLLFVVDDSGSMSGHQSDLKNNLGPISNALSNYANVNLAVITTSMVSYPGAKPSGGQFVGPVLNTSDKNFILPFEDEIMVGNAGDSIEKPLAAVAAALSPSLLSGGNAGFLRSTADLIIVFVTDSDDQSDLSTPQSVWAQLQALKPNNSIKAVAAMSRPGESNCTYDDPYPIQPGLKDFIGLAGGVVVDLCGDFSQTLPNALGQLNQVDNVFSLQIFPGTKVVTESIVVKLGSTVLTAGDSQNGWVYDSVANQLTIGSDLIAHTKQPTLTISYSLN